MRLERGCGYRKKNGLYLVGSGMAKPCGRIPAIIPACCPTCGGGVKQSRGPQWVNVALMGLKLNDLCEHKHCAVCPLGGAMKPRMLMLWVGKQHYSVEGFLKESRALGVSKRISALPKGFKVGEDWVMLAHPEGTTVRVAGDDCTCKELKLFEHNEYRPAVFMVFKPVAVEKIIERGTSDEEVEKLAKRGITAVKCDFDSKGAVETQSVIERYSKVRA